MRRTVIVLTALVALTVAGCGGGDPASEGASSTATTAPASGAVDSLEAVRGAVIRIEAEGTFDYPDSGTSYNEGSTGSGFFISPDGIAVTNNHVVTGAAYLAVHIDGEDEPRNARILGVSECSDLAVIDVDGDGFPYLAWHTESTDVGLTVYAAGHPLGDAEYTLLDGIVSKANADGESSWASVDSVIEHTADILPGNSGGPLVTAEGRLVGVNYAGNDDGQSFAIGRDEAEDVISQLAADIDVTSLGLNGTALYEDGSSGIWVHSVQSGSPADLAGIRGGDIVTEIEGIIPADDGTMSDYCDVLRSHRQSDPIQIEVYRDGGYLEATLNTDKTLAPVPGSGGEASGGGTTGTTAAPGGNDGGGEGPVVVQVLSVGDCFDDTQIPALEAGEDIQLTDCGQPHDNEVYHAFVLPDGPYPGDEAVKDLAAEGCLAQFESYVGRSYQESALDIFPLWPTEPVWTAGDRYVYCSVYDVNLNQLTGSANQSGW